jgi:predicted dehydrogenase
MANPPVRIGIIGCGAVATGSYKLAIEQLQYRGLAVVTTLCDARPERQASAQASYGDIPFTTEYQTVLESPDVDLVLILTSMREHGPIAQAALRAGKHVLVEKPMATSLAEAAELVTLAKTSPGFLVPAPHVILSNTYRAMQRHMQQGAIGKVTLARARYGHSGPTWGPWFYQAGGGPLFDLGVYNITTLTGLLGPAKRVMAMTGIAIPERIVDGQPLEVEHDDNVQLLIDFGDAAFAVVTTGFTMQRYRSPAVEIYGTSGTIQMLGNDFAPDGYELWKNDVGMWQSSERMDQRWYWTDGLNHLVDCIQRNIRPAITPEQGYHVLEIMIKAHESGHDGQARPIESSFTPHVW